MTQRFVIYAVIDPLAGEIFYIGHSGAFLRRKTYHLEGCDRATGARIKAIEEGGGQAVVVRLEERKSRVSALFAEDLWIDLLSSRGAGLLNRSPARDRGYHARRRKAGKPHNDRRSASRNGHLPPRTGELWSAEEEALVRGALKLGIGEVEVAGMIGRTGVAVRRRMKRIEKEKK